MWRYPGGVCVDNSVFCHVKGQNCWRGLALSICAVNTFQNNKILYYKIIIMGCFTVSGFLKLNVTHTHTHIYVCVCVYVCTYVYAFTVQKSVDR